MSDMRTYNIIISCLLLLLVSGCQQIAEVEFYPPSKENEQYSVKAKGGTPGRGPIKRINGKSGTPDFSDNKSFTFTLFKM